MLHLLPWKHNVFPCISTPVFGSMSFVFRHWPSIILGEKLNTFLLLALTTYNCLMICQVCTCILFNSVTTLLTRYHDLQSTLRLKSAGSPSSTRHYLRYGFLFTHSYCFLVSSHSAQWSEIKLHWWPPIELIHASNQGWTRRVWGVRPPPTRGLSDPTLSVFQPASNVPHSKLPLSISLNLPHAMLWRSITIILFLMPGSELDSNSISLTSYSVLENCVTSGKWKS